MFLLIDQLTNFLFKIKSKIDFQVIKVISIFVMDKDGFLIKFLMEIEYKQTIELIYQGKNQFIEALFY